YSVKGEVRGCDVVAVRGAEPPVVVELKRAFGISVVLQGVNRLTITDNVYLAVGAFPNNIRTVRKLCRRLGLGLIVVVGGRADVLLDPGPPPIKPRRDKRKLGRLLGEHSRRVGDPTLGGSSTKVPLMTAYRQEALRCAGFLAKNGPMKVAALRLAADAPKAAAILSADYYGWFERTERGIYQLTPKGREGLQQHGWKDPP
ncbi:MAG: DUF2161 family putative PD-(D/E)XK-type phosphodiesterase, partial [Rhodospirillaceae bacterium]